MRSLRISLHLLLGASTAVIAAPACDADGEADTPADPENGMFTGPKADGFCVEPGSPEAAGILALVNDQGIDLDELDRTDDGAGLYLGAAQSIVQLRPFATLPELDAAPWVGVSACGDLLKYACAVKGLCAPQACDPAAFPTLPATTAYDSRCEATLLAIAAGALTSGDRTSVTDSAARCDTLTDDQRAAFDAAAVAYGETPAGLTEEYGEFSVSVFQTAGGVVTVAHVIEEDNFIPYHVVLDGEHVAAVWTSDGLASGVDWYCGGEAGAEEALAPDEFCVGAITDEVELCDNGDLVRETLSATVGEFREDFVSLGAAAATDFADVLGLGDDAMLEVAIEQCGTSAADVGVAGGGSEAQFRVVDSRRGLGRTVLTRTVDGRTELSCATNNG